MSGALEGAVRAELDRLIPDGADGEAIGVAISGGGDSTALLLLSARWAAARGLRIEAATVDHGLRPESAAEAEAVAGLCARLGLIHSILRTGDLRVEGGNLPAAAREARLAALGGWAHGRGLRAVLLGHTLDDQAETVLMRLARGSGAEGLSGMAPERLHGGVRWLRPLLDIRRDDLRRFLEAEGVGWTDDPTNEAPEYDRVKARQALAALAPLGIDAQGLARTAWHLRRQRRVLDRAMAQLAGQARAWGALGEALLDPAALAADEEDTALRLLADSLRRVSGEPYRPRFRALSALLGRVLAGIGPGTALGGCLIAAGQGGGVLLCREPSACAGPLPLKSPGVTLWDRRWRLSASGEWPPGAVAGMLGEVGLSRLRKLAEDGGLCLPGPWSAAPRKVRLTVSAIWSAADPAKAVLLAAPSAGYVNFEELGPECRIRAEFIGAGELHSDQPTTYGPAGFAGP